MNNRADLDTPSKTTLSELVTQTDDPAVKLYNACKLREWDVTSEWMEEAPFVTIGNFMYILDYSGHMCMFPYVRPDYMQNASYSGVLGNRVIWHEGVMVNDLALQGETDILDKKNERTFPYKKIMSHLLDMSYLSDIMDQNGINTSTR